MGSVANTKSTYSDQTFKRTKSLYGNTTYESDLFRISSYTKNTPGTSWKTSGYTLNIKGVFGKAINFDTLKDAKAFVNSDEGKEYYNKYRKK